MPLLRSAPTRVQPYFGYRNRERLFLSARAIQAQLPGFKRSGRLQAVRTMLSQFASHEVSGLTVELEIKGPGGRKVRHRGSTDEEGFVHFEVHHDKPLEHGNETVWETVALHWENEGGLQCVEGHVLSPGTDARIGVISDIDDTIIETGITGNFRAIARNWRRVVMQMPDERLLVPGADVFYGALGGGAPLASDDARAGKTLAATRHPFFYVSSSPWNLFSYLVAFKKSRSLPLGPIMLRDWGLNKATFGHSSHGAHKRAAIAGILATYPDLRFALVGDDTQGDLPAFGEAVAANPKQIRGVFIRRAGEAFTPEELEARATIEAAGVPLWFSEDYHAARDFLEAIGLSSDTDAEKIVETVDGGDAEKAE